MICSALWQICPHLMLSDRKTNDKKAASASPVNLLILRKGAFLRDLPPVVPHASLCQAHRTAWGWSIEEWKRKEKNR